MQPHDLIEKQFRLNPLQKKGLAKLGIKTVSDLLFHLPARYGEPMERRYIKDLVKGDKVSIVGKVLSATLSKAFVKKIPMAEVVLQDHTGTIKAIWFHQAYMAKKVLPGHTAQISGTVQERKGELYIANPEMQEANPGEMDRGGTLWKPAVPEETPLRAGVYPESRGISSLWIQHAVQKLLQHGLHEQVADPIPETILHKYHLPTLRTALVWIHTPRKDADAEAARKRFAFQEIFLIQIGRIKARRLHEKEPAYSIKRNKVEEKDFASRFPFTPTEAQQHAVEQILGDMSGAHPMVRLLEGDVGSGKTAVAALASHAVVNAGFEVAYMAPTEILANQHFESFIKYFKHLNIQVGLITGTECRKFPSKINGEEHTHISRAQLLKWVKTGQIPILIGTHALIQKSVAFKNLALVVIDEQHRFGTNQRITLRGKRSAKERAPHLLSMTATPIPRTLALTLYGDLDLTLIDQMPAGRKPIITEVVGPGERSAVYSRMRKEISEGRQAYVICPRIDEPDPDKEMALNAKSVTAEAERLAREVFPGLTVEVLHGKMKPAEKDDVMADFLSGKTKILVATSVVEVGVNVPNATVILIEGADRFGLAQLHQLRGRVIRSNHQAYCFALTESKSQKTKERLHALKTAKNGFELAEYDLEQRGAGALGGGKQWGITDIGMEAIRNIKMVEAARHEASQLLAEDPELTRHPGIKLALGKTPEVYFD